ncbi:uncharacterized protein LOC122544414 [Chiloscyllium plagiosum]|uniref:uncharacterized protein LOC122544414 n=1 Tax=Chiloscyllium plagiosum TaxID=36176 RepID=UPI001CB8532B|nr:uncharacterized protein LOC122544414 [Chiloscyllium plagiosum]
MLSPRSPQGASTQYKAASLGMHQLRVSNKELVSYLKGQITSHRKMHRPIDHVEKVFYTILAVTGIPVNLLAVANFSRQKCGISPCTTRYLVFMAAADLMVIITEVILWRLPFYYYLQSFLNITPVCSVIGALSRAARDCSVWFTVTFSFDRFVTICCQKLRTKYCTEKAATVVLATTCTLFCLKNIPFAFEYEAVKIINNVPFYCRTKLSNLTATCQTHFSDQSSPEEAERGNRLDGNVERSKEKNCVKCTQTGAKKYWKEEEWSRDGEKRRWRERKMERKKGKSDNLMQGLFLRLTNGMMLMNSY